MARHHRVWYHALKSTRLLFVLILLGIFLIDLLTQYIDIRVSTILLVTFSAVVPSMVSVWFAHSKTPEMHYIPSVVILIVGVIMGGVLALGCDMGWTGAICFDGFAGPAVLLGVMISWAGLTYAFGLGSYKKMLRHGKIK